jgi:hypothetical protein
MIIHSAKDMTQASQIISDLSATIGTTEWKEPSKAAATTSNPTDPKIGHVFKEAIMIAEGWNRITIGFWALIDKICLFCTFEFSKFWNDDWSPVWTPKEVHHIILETKDERPTTPELPTDPAKISLLSTVLTEPVDPASTLIEVEVPTPLDPSSLTVSPGYISSRVTILNPSDLEILIALDEVEPEVENFDFINEQSLALLQDNMLADPEFQEFQALSLTVNDSMLQIYHDYPMVQIVMDAAIVTVAEDISNITYNLMMEAAKNGTKLTADVLFRALTYCLADIVDEKAVKPTASFLLNYLFFNSMFDLLNPAKILDFSPLGLMTNLTAPLKIFLLNGMGKRFIQAQEKKIDDKFEGYFKKLLEQIDITKHSDNFATRYVQKGLDSVCIGLKEQGKAEVKRICSEGFTLALDFLKQKVTENGLEKYYTIAGKFSDVLYEGSDFPNSYVGQMTNQLILTPLAKVGEGAQILHAPINFVKRLACQNVFAGFRGGVAAANLVANKFPDAYPVKCIAYCYGYIAAGAKDGVTNKFLEYTVQDRFLKVRNDLGKTIITSFSPVIGSGNASALTPFIEPIAADKLEVAEFKFFNHLESVVCDQTVLLARYVEEQMAQLAYKEVFKLFDAAYKLVGIKPAVTNDDDVIDVNTLERIFNPDSKYNFENLVDDIYIKAKKTVEDFIVSNQMDSNLVLKLTMASSALAGIELNFPTVKQSLIEAKAQFENKHLKEMIKEARKQICPDIIKQKKLDKYSSMTVEEATTIVLKYGVNNYINDAVLTSLSIMDLGMSPMALIEPPKTAGIVATVKKGLMNLFTRAITMDLSDIDIR